MSFLSHLFNNDSKRTSREVQDSYWNIGLLILTAATKCYDQILPHISHSKETTQKESEGTILVQLVFFFQYFALKTVRSKGWSTSEIKRLEKYLVPQIAKVLINQLFPNVGNSTIELMQKNIIQQWDSIKKDYDSSELFTSENQLNRTYVSPKFAMMIAGLCGNIMNNDLIYSIAKLVIEESENIRSNLTFENARFASSSDKS